MKPHSHSSAASARAANSVKSGLTLLILLWGLVLAFPASAQNYNTRVVEAGAFQKQAWDRAAGEAYYQPQIDHLITHTPGAPFPCGAGSWYVPAMWNPTSGVPNPILDFDPINMTVPRETLWLWGCDDGNVAYFQLIEYECRPGYRWDPSISYRTDRCVGGDYGHYFVVAPVTPPRAGNPKTPPKSCPSSCPAPNPTPAAADPIEVGTGNMFLRETDFISAEPRLQFSRVYNSNTDDSGKTTVGNGWQGDLAARHILTMEAGLSKSVASFMEESSVYTTANDACTQGWLEIATGGGNSSQVDPKWAGVTATYDDQTAQCNLSNGQSMPVLATDTSVGLATNVDLAKRGVTVRRGDGSLYWFYCSQGICKPSIGVGLHVTMMLDATGYTILDDDGNIELYDSAGYLRSITYKDDYQLSFAYKDDNISNGSLSGGDGTPLSITDNRGRAITFGYDASGMLSSISTPGGTTVSYQHDAFGRLTSVTNPTGTRTYQYTSASFPNALTGILDEDSNGNPNPVPYTTWTYDGYQRATSSVHAGGADLTTLVYNTDGSVNVTDALGTQRTYNFQNTFGFPQLTSITGPFCADCGAAASMSYDGNGSLQGSTDWNGNVTGYQYDANGLPTQLVEAQNTPVQRTTNLTWDSFLRSPLEQSVKDSGGNLKAKIDWQYNSIGEPLARCEEDPTVTGATSYVCANTGTPPAGVRRWTYDYCTAVDGTKCPLTELLLSVTDPLGHATNISYYMSNDGTCVTTPTTCPHRKGDLWKVTNALGQVTEMLAYDGAGRVLSVKDPNGVVTDMTYSPRGWLTALKVRGPDNTVETDDAITRIYYWPTGLVKQVTPPGGSYTAYGYDAAHRLTDISDNVGNTLHYTLDNAGNRTGEDTKDPIGTLTRTLSRLYNQLGQLQRQQDAASHATTFTYDANGNNDLVTDAASHVTDNDYDPLNRLSQTLQDVGGIAAGTRFQYDVVDNLTQVTDPNGLITGYGYDGLGNLTSLSSPDTGLTRYTYDSAGNRKTRTDARSKVTNHSYDALNRLTATAYATTSLNITSTYDTVNAVCGSGETFAAGRLAKLTTGYGNTTQYCYDRFGNPVRKVETINGKTFTLRYGYDLAGRLMSLIYPDGAVADYVRNAVGQVLEIGVTRPGNARQVLLTSATYYPFGPVWQWAFGNGRTLQRTYDFDYRPWSIADTSNGGLSLGYAFNAVGNLAELRGANQAGPPQVTFGYDGLNRLTDFLDGPTGATIEHYAYNATGDRTLFQDSSGSQTNAYNSGTHRLGSVATVNRTYDLVGNTLSIGGTAQEYTFADNGRMDSTKRSKKVVMNYRYNGKGERVHQFLTTNGTTQIYTVYDEAGHWLGDYNSAGATIQQAIWLDDLSVGLLAGAGTSQKLDYIEADALGTPRAVIDPTRNLAIWSWDLKGEAFGSSPPNQNPDGDNTAFVFNLRFPGQRYDSAANLNYNYFRDYDSATGRYIESDPIGLSGGISTYAYVGGSPISNIDPLGLASCFYSIGDGRLVCYPDTPGESVVSIPVSSGNNGAGMNCKDNPACTNLSNRGPLPTGGWVWNPNGWTGKPNGRVLEPVSGTNDFGRGNIRSHSCANPFGPALGPKFCSEGCVTGTSRDIQTLNTLIDAEPGSTLQVMDYFFPRKITPFFR